MNKIKEIINIYPKWVWALNIFAIVVGLIIIAT
jgi:hypothetical protein